MNREELIEAAKRALSDYDIAKARHVSVAPDRLAILLAEFVAVFEQVYAPTRTVIQITPEAVQREYELRNGVTPTDDEREALRIAELDARQAAHQQDRVDWWVDHEHEPEITSNAFFRGWDAASDALRRTVQGEPPRHPALIANRTINKAIQDGEVGGWESIIRVEQAHELIVEALTFDRSERFEHPVQDEPTDAQVEAARLAYVKSWGDPQSFRMRAALRAAAATQEGENRG